MDLASISKSRFAAFAMAGIAATSSFSTVGFAQSAQQVSVPAQCASINTATVEGKARQLDCTMQYDTNRARAQTRANQAQIGTNQAQIAQNQTETGCAEKIKSEIGANRITPEQLSAVLAGRPARDVGACNILRQLTRS